MTPQGIGYLYNAAEAKVSKKVPFDKKNFINKMKIIAGLVIAANGVEFDRSVPPRHPINRLAR